MIDTEPTAKPTLRAIRRPRRPRQVLVAVAAVLALITVGGVGLFRYARSYYVYRGFPAPVEQSFVQIAGPTGVRAQIVPVVKGTTRTIDVWSPSLGTAVQTYVFLPPGYSSHPSERYPVLYFLHGLKTQGFTFLTVLGGAVNEDVLVAEHRLKPMIFVIPTGPWSTDHEWADGARGAWETFVAHDLVSAIDARYRTVRSPRARVLAGLSEGGYGAFNIGVHEPNVFGVIESWSGYTIADPTSGVFGRDPAVLAYNSPLDQVRMEARRLRRFGTYFWFYIGTRDEYLRQNWAFADELVKLGIPHRFFVARGGHVWRLWRANLVMSLLIASEHVYV